VPQPAYPWAVESARYDVCKQIAQNGINNKCDSNPNSQSFLITRENFEFLIECYFFSEVITTIYGVKLTWKANHIPCKEQVFLFVLNMSKTVNPKAPSSASSPVINKMIILISMIRLLCHVMSCHVFRGASSYMRNLVIFMGV
jgi:hypothetical protein